MLDPALCGLGQNDRLSGDRQSFGYSKLQFGLTGTALLYALQSDADLGLRNADVRLTGPLKHLLQRLELLLYPQRTQLRFTVLALPIQVQC